MSGYMQEAKGIYLALSGGTTLTSFLGGTKIYNTVAPSGGSLPYVVFQHYSGGYENETPTDSTDDYWLIKCIARNASVAGSAADMISSILHKTELTAVSGWENFQTTMRWRVAYIEADMGETLYHAGGVFRIRMSKK